MDNSKGWREESAQKKWMSRERQRSAKRESEITERYIEPWGAVNEYWEGYLSISSMLLIKDR